MKVTIQQQINELTTIKSSLYSAINAACTARNKPTIPSSKQGDFAYYAAHIRTYLCSGDTPTTTYTVTATSSNTMMGTVSGGGTYTDGETVTLTAFPKTGYRFVNWTKGGTQKSTNTSYSFTASASTAGEYVANFAVNTWTVTASSNDTSMGTVAPASSTVNDGGSVTLTATVTDNNTYKFLGWRKGSSTTYVSTSATYTVTNVTANASYTGVFAERTGSFKVTIVGGGRVTYKVDGETAKNVVSGQAYNIPKDSGVLLTATANSGYSFDNWSGDESSTSTSVRFTIEEGVAKAYTAKFVADTPDRVAVLYHLCQADNDACGNKSGFTQALLIQNPTVGAIGNFLDRRVSSYQSQEITNLSQTYTTEGFTNAAIFLIPQGYGIDTASWIDGVGSDQPMTFDAAANGGGEYGYLFPKGENDSSDYYVYNSQNYSVYIGLFGGDVNGIKYKIGKTE